MPINFPINPTSGQTYAFNNFMWSWNGSAWEKPNPSQVSSFNGLTGAVQGVSAAVAGTGISVSGATGSVTFTNTGVQSFNGLTGSIQGVSAAVAGTGISVSGATGSVTFTNTGVQSINGSTGAITNIALTTGKLSQFASTTSSELAGVISDETGSGALVFGTSPSITTALNSASTALGIANTTATTLTIGSVATTGRIFGYTGNLAETQTVTVAGANTGSSINKTVNIGTGSGSNGTITVNVGQSPSEGTGIINLLSNTSITGTLATTGNITAPNIITSFNGLTGAVQGVSAAVAGTGISVSGATGSVTFTNTGVQSFNGLTGSIQGVSAAVAGTGISVSGATGSVTFTNTGVQSVNGLTGAVTNIALTTGKLSQFASTTSSELAGVISNETGSGSLVFGTSPTITNNLTVTNNDGAGLTGTTVLSSSAASAYSFNAYNTELGTNWLTYGLDGSVKLGDDSSGQNVSSIFQDGIGGIYLTSYDPGGFGDSTQFYMNSSAFTFSVLSETTITLGAVTISGLTMSTNTVVATRSGASVATFNRTSSDGQIISLKQAGTEEGSISVSGTTITYGTFSGSHIGQFADGSTGDILRGTVMETVEELCEWVGEVPPEQLTKVKISDTIASKRVYGVFMDWDREDSVNTHDMLVTSLGAFVVRIASSVVVQGGDLLESNGDGCARVQSDDIVRSSTIGKVSASIATHTHPDGSYCVPCVLYCG